MRSTNKTKETIDLLDDRIAKRFKSLEDKVIGIEKNQETLKTKIATLLENPKVRSSDLISKFFPVASFLFSFPLSSALPLFLSSFLFLFYFFQWNPCHTGDEEKRNTPLACALPKCLGKTSKIPIECQARDARDVLKWKWDCYHPPVSRTFGRFLLFSWSIPDLFLIFFSIFQKYLDDLRTNTLKRKTLTSTPPFIQKLQLWKESYPTDDKIVPILVGYFCGYLSDEGAANEIKVALEGVFLLFLFFSFVPPFSFFLSFCFMVYSLPHPNHCKHLQETSLHGKQFSITFLLWRTPLLGVRENSWGL